MSSKPRRKNSTILIAVLLVVVVIEGFWLLRNQSDADEKPDRAASKTMAVTQEQVDAVVGRWRRPDGGYIIEIRGLDSAGNLMAAYYNPNPIHVSQARAEKRAGRLHVFIELNDTGYPGATYRLDYDSAQDMLTGVYHQPAADQSFEVVFAREQ